MSAPRPRRCARSQPLDGRGRRHRIAVAGDGAAELIDESYNASPASMRARASPCSASTSPARARGASPCWATCCELGDDGAAPPCRAGRGRSPRRGVDLVFTVGADMRALYDALPKRLRGGHAATRGRDGGDPRPAARAPATSSRSRAPIGSRMARW